MENQKQVIVHKPFPLTTALGITFIVLKLCKVINWPWLWVLSPFWIPWAIVIAAFLLSLLLMLIGGFCIWLGTKFKK